MVPLFGKVPTKTVGSVLVREPCVCDSRILVTIHDTRRFEAVVQYVNGNELLYLKYFSSLSEKEIFFLGLVVDFESRLFL